MRGFVRSTSGFGRAVAAGIVLTLASAAFAGTAGGGRGARFAPSGGTHAHGGKMPRWVQLATPASPPRRYSHTMAYDGVSQKVLLFGGSGLRDYLADTWLFDGATWTQVATPSAPSARAASGMAFDKVTGQVVLFGGFDGQTHLGDTWVWDGATETWTEVQTPTTPPGVSLPMMFTDPLSGHAIMIGGFGGMFYYNDTWQWTGTDWLLLAPQDSPTARGAAISALDPLRHSAVIFSGLASLNAYDTWTWDGVDWARQAPSVQPSARFYSAAGYDPITANVILFGGNDGSGDLGDTWSWDGTSWTQLKSPQGPSARDSHGMAYDEAIGRLVLFGGIDPLNIYSDTWVFGGK